MSMSRTLWDKICNFTLSKLLHQTYFCKFSLMAFAIYIQKGCVKVLRCMNNWGKTCQYL